MYFMFILVSKPIAFAGCRVVAHKVLYPSVYNSNDSFLYRGILKANPAPCSPFIPLVEE